MSTKKTPSLAAPLDAQEVKYRTPKSWKKERSVHEMEMAEVARQASGNLDDTWWLSWSKTPEERKAKWRHLVRVVLEEAIYRVEANIK